MEKVQPTKELILVEAHYSPREDPGSDPRESSS